MKHEKKTAKTLFPEYCCHLNRNSSRAYKLTLGLAYGREKKKKTGRLGVP